MGFPNVPSRAAFGPEPLINKSEVNDNRKEIGAGTFNLAWWQLAGCGLCVDAAYAIIDSGGNLLHSGEVWDPNGLVAPSVAHPGAGVYELTYPASAVDETNASHPIVLKAGAVTVQGATANIVGVVEIYNSNRSARVRLTTANTGAPVDASFLLKLKI